MKIVFVLAQTVPCKVWDGSPRVGLIVLEEGVREKQLSNVLLINHDRR